MKDKTRARELTVTTCGYALFWKVTTLLLVYVAHSVVVKRTLAQSTFFHFGAASVLT